MCGAVPCLKVMATWIVKAATSKGTVKMIENAAVKCIVQCITMGIAKKTRVELMMKK